MSTLENIKTFRIEFFSRFIMNSLVAFYALYAGESLVVLWKLCINIVHLIEFVFRKKSLRNTKHRKQKHQNYWINNVSLAREFHILAPPPIPRLTLTLMTPFVSLHSCGRQIQILIYWLFNNARLRANGGFINYALFRWLQPESC